MEIIMEKNNKVLFVTEKWCDADPNKGLTNNYHNLFGTFRNTFPDTQFNIVHMDEYSLRKKQHIDNFLMTLIERSEPDIVIFSLLGKSNLNPTNISLKFIKERGCKTVFMWPDVFDGWGIPEIQELNVEGLADLHVCWGSEKNFETEQDNVVWLWAPQDETLYHPLENNMHTLESSFLGSPRYPERQKFLTHLLTSGAKVFIGGGQREEGLTPMKYAELMRNSKISINFPQGPDGYDQCKGRVWEILASKSLLLERKNNATAALLTEGVHYIEFTDEEDLAAKIDYYLENDGEREHIAEKGYQRFKEAFTAKVFWNTIMERIK